jgi:transposase-like protein
MDAVSDRPRCPTCDSEEISKAGLRKLKSGTRQLYRCSSCRRRFSSQRRSAKRTPGRAILDTLCMVCEGRTYADIAHAIRKKHRLSVSSGTISKWVTDFHPPYLAARSLNVGHKVIVRSYLFAHHGLNYNYKVHLRKLATSRYPALKRFLLVLPRYLNHGLFNISDAATARCSTLTAADDLRITTRTDTTENTLARKALTLATTNRERHAVIESYFLSCDRNTLAVEVPIYFYHKRFNTVTGHIDILQEKFGMIWLLDFKPNAHKENPRYVAAQLTLYAMGVSYRARIPIKRIRCAYFDDTTFHELEPRPESLL